MGTLTLNARPKGIYPSRVFHASLRSILSTMPELKSNMRIRTFTQDAAVTKAEESYLKQFLLLLLYYSGFYSLLYTLETDKSFHEHI